MSLVVSDTSPLTNLAAIGRLVKLPTGSFAMGRPTWPC